MAASVLPKKPQVTSFLLTGTFVILILCVVVIGWLGLSRMTLMNNATQHVTDELWKKVTAIPQPEENEFLKVISQRDNGEI